jgi:CO/xanthine dehydrogenase Mo-binding subunit
MNAFADPLSRRGVLLGAGALIVSFSFQRQVSAQERTPGPSPATPPLPGSLKTSPMLDSWIRIDADGITVFTGKAELGQGIKTAVVQVAAEELSVEPRAINLVTADTSRTPNEGYTSGSQSMQDSATAIRHAAAQAREILVKAAASRLGTSADRLIVRNGVVTTEDGRSLRYGELVTNELLHVQAQPQSKLKDPGTFAVIGQPIQRVDIPAKVTGGLAYVQDLRLPGMVHARVVRPPNYGARLRSVGTGQVENMPGVLKVVRDGSFLAVIAEKEYLALRAMDVLALTALWDEANNTLPNPAHLYDWLRSTNSEDHVIFHNQSEPSAGTPAIEAVYHRPYQIHGSIGPSCAVALSENEMLTVWSHTQGVYPLRMSIAEMLRLPQNRVHCIHMEGSGCYGHNGADDVAADAALIAAASPGRPVRVQWMREDEHGWEPYGPAMVTQARASLDGTGTIVDWQYDVWSNSHSTRPGGAGNLMPAWHLAAPFVQPKPEPIPQPTGGGDRNAIPLYKFANTHVVHHFLPEMPIRVSALRSLGAYMNVFSIESFMDELAMAAGADPVEFRLRHLQDAHARDVILLAAERFGWKKGDKPPKGRGRGFAFARYKNLAAFTAIAVELEVEHETGRVRPIRFVAANDSGQIVNPDGIRNQIEGAIVQSTSWTLHEALTFDNARITSRDWAGYPILRFPELPNTIEVHLIDRPGEPFLGTGETGQGPAAAAIANAVADATGVRIRELPLTRKRVKEAIGV